MSRYTDALELLTSLRCEPCNGTGEKWVCEACRGSGFKPMHDFAVAIGRTAIDTEPVKHLTQVLRTLQGIVK